MNYSPIDISAIEYLVWEIIGALRNCQLFQDSLRRYQECCKFHIDMGAALTRELYSEVTLTIYIIFVKCVSSVADNGFNMNLAA